MNDFLEEEMQIMDEREASLNQSLTAKTFDLMIEKMEPHRPIMVDEKATLAEVVAILQSKKMGSVLVHKNGILSGIITERDFLMKVLGKISDLKNTKVTEVMTANPLALRMGDKIAYVMNNMHVGGYRHVPIVDDENRPIGIISIKDVMSFILDHFPEHVTNITGEPYRGPVKRDSA